MCTTAFPEAAQTGTVKSCCLPHDLLAGTVQGALDIQERILVIPFTISAAVCKYYLVKQPGNATLQTHLSTIMKQECTQRKGHHRPI